MAKTFWADCPVFPEYNEDTAQFLKEQWRVNLRAVNEVELKEGGAPPENLLGIVVRDYPEIMSRVEESGYFRTEPVVWQVHRISEQGITLYLVSHGGKSEDGEQDLWEEVFIFIPMGNVIAIHNVSEKFLSGEFLRLM